jgi:uncharacterized protein YndB with AHSA1/START domain
MVLRERIRMNATASQVWTILRDPTRMSSWNPHCVRSEAGEDTVHVGLRFQAAMRFGGGPERHLDCEVIACEPERILTLRFAGEAFPDTGEYVDETYVLQPVEGGTQVLHTVDFSHSGLPWFLKVLLKVVDVVGHKRGPSPLEGLKELAEDRSAERTE